MSKRSQAILNFSEAYASEHERWSSKKQYFQAEDIRYLRFLIPEGLRVLDLGCGFGDKLAALKPIKGIGVDFSNKTLNQARIRHPNLEFILTDMEDKGLLPLLSEMKTGSFDVILLSDSIGLLEDCQQTLAQLLPFCKPDTRIIISYYSMAWNPIIKVAEILEQKFPQPDNNYLSTTDISNLLNLAGFNTIKREWRILCPKYFLGLGPLINRFLATLPIIRRFCLRHYIVARPAPATIAIQNLSGLSESEKSNNVSENASSACTPSTTVVITCRNERGNIEPAIQRLPQFCEDIEILFVEGHSQDGTLEEIHRVIKAYPNKNIKVCVQTGRGKGDAVRLGFEKASKDVLMILDGDLTTPPEDMPKFYEALVSGKGEFINGTRLIYPMENQAMQFLNFVANKGFSWIFSFLLNQHFTDTLCGTKVLYKKDYQKIAENRHYFGDFDPFGDFDLIFGASKLNLKVVEIPVRYKARSYGSTQISRFRHGWLLLQMVLFAYRKLKAF